MVTVYHSRNCWFCSIEWLRKQLFLPSTATALHILHGVVLLFVCTCTFLNEKVAFLLHHLFLYICIMYSFKNIFAGYLHHELLVYGDEQVLSAVSKHADETERDELSDPSGQ